MRNLCIYIAWGFEKSKVRIVRYKKIKNKKIKKDVDLMTSYRLGKVNETYKKLKEYLIIFG